LAAVAEKVRADIQRGHANRGGNFAIPSGARTVNKRKQLSRVSRTSLNIQQLAVFNLLVIRRCYDGGTLVLHTGEGPAKVPTIVTVPNYNSLELL